jgi:hypothetical protein
MSQFNTTEAEVIQREVIMPGIRQFMNSATVKLKHLEKEEQNNPTGEFIIVYNKERDNNAGTGYPEEGVDYVEAGVQKAGRATVPSKQLATRVKWTGKVVAATKTKDSLVDAIVYQTEGAARDHKTSKNRQLNSDGRDALGFYVSGGGSATVVVTDQWGNVGGDFFQTGTTRVDLINGEDGTVNQTGIYALRGALVATGRQITLKDSSGAALNLNGSASGFAGNKDYFVLSNTISAGVGRQLMGTRGLISNVDPPLLAASGLQGTLVANVPDFVSQIVLAGSNDTTTAGWGDLKYYLLQRVLTEIARNSDLGSEGIKFIVTSYPGLDTYVDMCKSERITVNSMTLDGGFDGVSFNRLIMVPDKHYRLGSYEFINPSTIKLFNLAPLDWDESDGSMFYRLSGGDRDAIGATLKEYTEAGIVERNANGALNGVNMLFV